MADSGQTGSGTERANGWRVPLVETWRERVPETSNPIERLASHLIWFVVNTVASEEVYSASASVGDRTSLPDGDHCPQEAVDFSAVVFAVRHVKQTPGYLEANDWALNEETVLVCRQFINADRLSLYFDSTFVTNLQDRSDYGLPLGLLKTLIEETRTEPTTPLAHDELSDWLAICDDQLTFLREPLSLGEMLDSLQAWIHEADRFACRLDVKIPLERPRFRDFGSDPAVVAAELVRHHRSRAPGKQGFSLDRAKQVVLFLMESDEHRTMDRKTILRVLNDRGTEVTDLALRQILPELFRRGYAHNGTKQGEVDGDVRSLISGD